jgi:hypothetical protein
MSPARRPEPASPARSGPLSRAELDEQLEIAAGRRAPYTQLGDWVALSGIDSAAKALHWHLAMHVNQQRGDREVWPDRGTLAEFLGFSRPQSVDQYLDQLAGINAIEVFQRRYAGGLRARNVYLVHMEPPADYDGPRTLAEYYRRRRDAFDQDDAAGVPVMRSSAHRDVRSSALPVCAPAHIAECAPAHTAVCAPAHRNNDEEKQDEIEQEEEASPPPPVGEVDEHAKTARHVLSDMAVVRLGPVSVAELVPLFADALRAGWNPATLERHITRSFGGVRHPVAVLRRRLRDLPPPDTPRPARRPGRCQVHAQELPCLSCAAEAKAVVEARG